MIRYLAICKLKTFKKTQNDEFFKIVKSTQNNEINYIFDIKQLKNN